MQTILGKKLGMTQVFNAEGNAIPVTVIEVGPCPVLQRKTIGSDGYEAVQLAFDPIEAKRATKVANKPTQGHFKKHGLTAHRFIQEVRVQDVSKVSETISVTAFEGVGKVDVIGKSKGKGYQGTMKRHRFGGGPASHGSKVHRRPASTGSTQVGSCPGMKKPGQMGNERVTALGLSVVKIDAEKNLILVKGSVPGPNGRYVTVRKSAR